MVAARPGSLKRIFFDRIFQHSYWTWRRHPAIIVPTMLGTGLSAIGQSIITLAAMLVLTSFAMKGTLFDFLSSTHDEGLLQAIQSPAYSANIIPTATVVVIILAAALVLGGGFVLAAEYSTYLEAWQSDKASFKSMVENGSRRWKQMAWTLFLADTVTWAPFVAGLILVLITLPKALTPQGIGAFLASEYVLAFGLGASLVLSIFTLYSFPAVVVDQLSGVRALQYSFRVASHNLGVTLTYGVVRIIFQLLSSLLVLFAGLIGLPLSSLASAILSLLLTPVLHSTKTMIYYQAGPSIPETPFTLEKPIWNDIARKLPRAAWLKVRLGLSECARYIIGLRNIPFHAASAIGLVLGILLGNFVSNNGFKQYYLETPGYQPGRLNPLLTQVVPPALGVDLFLHNWQVSIAAALSGIGFGFPSFETILFNGFILGLLSPIIPTLTMLLAVILPHGIIEIPSFLLAGSVGIKLGYAATKAKTRPGPESRDYLATVLRQAVYIVIGLAPLFLIAGLIEADLTPFIATMFGWT